MNQAVELPLNAEQQAAADGFFAFLFNDEKEINLRGPGGVGKTYLMGYLIDRVLPQYFQTCALMGIEAIYTDVVMTATTNKAAEVLGVATGRPAQTAHSFFNLKVVDDYSTGKSKVSKTGAWKVHERKIIFVDEASMVDSALRQYINEGTLRCKIVYVGDHCQLAPVHESLSPVYRDNLGNLDLTIPMRTNVPELHAINQQLRDTVETGVFRPIQAVPGIIDVLNSDDMEAMLIDTFKTQNPASRILAYHNNRVNDYNAFIREIRGLPSVYGLHELLINNSAIRVGKGMLSVEEEVEIVEQAECSQFDEIDSGVSLEVIMTTLRDSYGNHIRVPVPVDRDHFTKLLAYYKRNKNWHKFFHLKNNYPDLRPRDAATVYKAQGSTYDSVFIDLGDLSTCPNPNQAARMLYVAFSRARHRVFLYGELAERFGGLIF